MPTLLDCKKNKLWILSMINHQIAVFVFYFIFLIKVSCDNKNKKFSQINISDNNMIDNEFIVDFRSKYDEIKMKNNFNLDSLDKYNIKNLNDIQKISLKYPSSSNLESINFNDKILNKIQDNHEVQNLEMSDLSQTKQPIYLNFLNITNPQLTNRKNAVNIFTPLLLGFKQFLPFNSKNEISNRILKFKNNFASGDDSSDTLFDALVNFLRQNIVKSLLENATYLSNECKNNLTEAYVNNDTSFFYLKALIDSTKNKNDVGSFQDCIFNSYGNGTQKLLKYLEYVVINIDNENSDTKKNSSQNNLEYNNTEYEKGYFIFGICFRKGCNSSEVASLIYNSKTEGNLFRSFTEDKIKVYSLGEDIFEFETSDLLNLIPLVFIIIQIIFSLFPYIPAKLFAKLCFRTKRMSPDNTKIFHNNHLYSNDILTTNTNTNNNNNTFGDLTNNEYQNKSNINYMNNLSNKNQNNSHESPKTSQILKKNCKDKIKKLEKIFSLLRNIQDLFLINFTKENIKPVYDFSSIGYIIGIRGISMFSIIIGYVYLILYESPIKIYCEFSYFNLIRSTMYNIIATGIRMSPRILFACSGYCLGYKILVYFDKKMILIREGGSGDVFVDEQNFINPEENCVDKYDPQNINLDSEKNNTHKLPAKYLFSFIFKQYHKYLLYLFALIFFKFTLYTLFSYIGQVGPMWVFFQNYVINQLTIRHLLYHVFLLDQVGDFTITEKNYLYLFWIISLEIKFFILTSVLFYFAFRRNNRFDILVVVIIPIIMILKIFIYFILKNCDIEFYPSIYYKFNLFYKYSITPYYNYGCYLIGVIFGIINFIHQKSLSYEQIKSQGKSYLIIPYRLYKMLTNLHNSRNKSPKVLLCIFVIIGLLLAFSQKIIFYMLDLTEKKDLNSDYFKQDWINCFYLIDVEIFIILLLVVCSGIAKSEGNFFFNILKSNYWIFKNKIYFGFILMMNPLISYIFYQSESRVKIEFFNVLFLSIVCYMNIFIYSSIFYILFDAPFKKFNRYILKAK